METKKCPFCGEEIFTVAVKCKHCKSDLQQSPAAVNAKIAANEETIGYVQLLIPIIGIFLIWFWIGNMTLMNNPGSWINFISAGVVISTAVLAAYEGNQLEFGQKDPESGKAKESGPIPMFFGVLLLWIFVYPYYFYVRAKKGRKNLLVGAIFVAIGFILSYFVMGEAINEKINELRNIFDR